MPPLLQPVIYLSPSKGPILVVTDNETWLGRGSFELSEKAQLLCSRRQACLKLRNAAVTLECHGLNPVYFAVCHAVNFRASLDTSPSRLHQLRRGESVELVDGDKFFLAPKECLLTVAIKNLKSGYDEASEHLTPDAAELNVHDDRSLAVQVYSPKATQPGQYWTNSTVEQHRLLQEGVPLSAEVCMNFANRCLSGDACTGSPTKHKGCFDLADESCQCNVLTNILAAPSGLEVPGEDSTVHQVDSSKTGRSRDPARGEAVIDRRISVHPSEIDVASDSRDPLVQFRLDSCNGENLLSPNQRGILAAGNFVHGNSCGSTIDTSQEILMRCCQPVTVSCAVDSKRPPKLGDSDPDVRDGSNQVSTRDISDDTSSPPLADGGDPVSVEVLADTRGSNSEEQIAVVSVAGPFSECFRSDLSAPGGISLNSIGRCTLAANCSMEETGRSSSHDITGDVNVQSIHLETLNFGLDARGLPDPDLESFLLGHEAGKQTINKNVSGHTASPLSPRANQVQENNSSAMDFQQKCPLTANFSGTAVFRGFPEEARDSTSAAILGKQGAAEMLDRLLEQEPADPNPPLETVPSSQIPLPGGISSDAPTLLFYRKHCREPEAKRPISQSEGMNQNQAESQTYPIQGMAQVVVTVSGYEDLLRARLINLIYATGAAYTGSLTKLNTHVVCWKFRGAKYEMAKKLGKTIVNHRWFDDCLRAGIRLPEGPYYASGEKSEPLCWDPSVLQYPSSAAGIDHVQDRNSLLSGPSRGQARSTIVIGESSRSAERLKQSVQSKFSPSHVSTLNRGKTHVEPNRSASRGDDCLDDCPVRAVASTADFSAISLSTPTRPQQQESDDFWNEVIRVYDDRNELVTKHSFLVASEANNTAAAADNTTGSRNHVAAPIPGSSLRGLDVYPSEIASGGRSAVASSAEVSLNVEDEMLQGTTLLHSLVGEQAGNTHSEVDHRRSHPEVYHRKRKHALEIAKYRRWKSRQLKSLVSAASGDLPCQGGNVVGTGIGIEGRPPLTSAAAQEETVTANTNVLCEETPCGIIADTVGQTGENAEAPASSNEISCVICHSDTRPLTEGLLGCGHQFCYPCIQRWADEAKSKSPTCPLCKVPFDFITFREMGKAGEDGSYAVLEERIAQIGQQIPQETRLTSLPSLRTENLCVSCGSRDTPELLLVCTNCRERACHTFCLDPPRPPGSSWFCSRCSQMQSRMQTREAYGRLFQSSPRSARHRQGTVETEMNVDVQSIPTSRVGALVVGQSSGTPPRMNYALESRLTTRVDGLVGRQSSGTPSRRGRQNSLHSFLVRQNDT